MKRLAVICLTWLSVFVACGSPGDSPEECTNNEFFDETLDQCVTCPAVAEPECSPGCGFVIDFDDVGCPLARCLSGDECDRCGPAEYFSSTVLECRACDGPQSCGPEGEEEPEKVVRDDSCTTRCPQ